jgi:hypothetical protein
MADDGGNRSVLQNAVVALNGIWNVLQNSFLFGQGSLTVGVSTVSGLPTDATQGDRRMVTDANATTFASVVAGGGSNIVPVYWDGSDWRIG